MRPISLYKLLPALIIASLMLTACGQKGDLYRVDPDGNKKTEKDIKHEQDISRDL
ncbi:MAG: lipoprotein [gamma proteobacterium symbiont of Bathyaustriella thionipta]|nr:lipoprotein [gamma proteobacterium symbiont of Bathyaustriella thionipta]